MQPGSQQVLTSLDDMKTYISTTGPLVGVFKLYNDFSHYHDGVFKHAAGFAHGGHCVSVIGYDDDKAAWFCQNSFGAEWGIDGYFWIGYGECGIDAAMIAMNDLRLISDQG